MKLYLLRERISSAITRPWRGLRRRIYAMNGIRIGDPWIIHPGAIVDTRYGGSITIGNFCEVHHGALVLSYGGKIEIGDQCTINPYCVIYGHGGLRIGNGVRIAAHTVIIPANHNYEDPTKPIYLQGERCVGITIEDDVWIGAGARVLDGVTIARGCVIGAGTIVTRSTEPFGVYVGNPAKKIRSRERECREIRDVLTHAKHT